MTHTPTEQDTRAKLTELLHSSDDSYVVMNRIRDWFNAHFPDFDLYLEDVWNDHVPGETHFEYILRSKETYNESEVLAYDVYKNHQDANAVWHLDDYTHTVIHLKDVRPILDFVNENGPPWQGNRVKD